MLKRLIAFLTASILVLGIGSVNVFATDFSITDISVSEGVIPSDIGEITITMSDEIDRDTLNSICFVKSDGSSVRGGSYVDIGEDASQAVVRFGRLDIGSYKLEVKEGLASTDGVKAVSSALFYEVKTNDPRDVIAEPDFKDTAVWESKTYSNDDFGSVIENVIPFEGTTAVGSECTVDTENGTVTVGNSTKSSGGVQIDTQSLSTGGLMMEFKFQNKDKGTFNDNGGVLGIMMNTSTSAIPLLGTSSGGHILVKGNGGSGMGIDSKYNAPSSDGWFHIRAIISRENETDNWQVMVYNLSKSDTVAVYAPAAALGDGTIEGIRLGCLKQGKNRVFKDISVWKPAEQRLVYADTLVDASKDGLNVVFFEDEDADNVNAVLTQDGDEIDADIEYNDDTRTLTVNPRDYLDKDKEYLISFTNGYLSDEISVYTSGYPVSVTDVSYDDGKISYYLTGDGAKRNLKVFAVGYDAAGKLMKGAVYGDDTVSGSEPVEKTLSAESLSACNTVKLMVWELADRYMRPVCQPINISIDN